jgi:hypothetical protein
MPPNNEAIAHINPVNDKPTTKTNGNEIELKASNANSNNESSDSTDQVIELARELADKDLDVIFAIKETIIGIISETNIDLISEKNRRELAEEVINTERYLEGFRLQNRYVGILCLTLITIFGIAAGLILFASGKIILPSVLFIALAAACAGAIAAIASGHSVSTQDFNETLAVIKGTENENSKDEVSEVPDTEVKERSL